MVPRVFICGLGMFQPEAVILLQFQRLVQKSIFFHGDRQLGSCIYLAGVLKEHMGIIWIDICQGSSGRASAVGD